MIRLDSDLVLPFIADHLRDGMHTRASAAHLAVLHGTGQGNEWLGWQNMLRQPNDALLEDIAALGEEIRARADVLLCIGIGGSYLGAEAVIKALSPYFSSPIGAAGAVAPASPSAMGQAPGSVGENASLFGPAPARPAGTPTEVVFAGHHLSGRYLEQLLSHLEGKSVMVNVISKSGTTLEPAIAFRIVRQWMQKHFKDASSRIIVSTDPEQGALRELAKKEGYRSYDIPADVGGRFSVLTPVGLIPIAAAGFDVRTLFYGAVAQQSDIEKAPDNIAVSYAANRYALHESGFTTEVLSVFEPRLSGIGGWWQQLFGESEGKDKRGIFPVTCTFSSDLHSLGQYLQEGRRNLIETFLMVEDDRGGLAIPGVATSDGTPCADGLDFVAGLSMSDVTTAAFEGTRKAHIAGGVPVQTLHIDTLSEGDIGRLILFFEHAVAVGGYLMGINPFDQPGVEAYKREMFARLGR